MFTKLQNNCKCKF